MLINLHEVEGNKPEPTAQYSQQNCNGPRCASKLVLIDLAVHENTVAVCSEKVAKP